MTAGGACLCEEEYLRACEDKVREIVREYEFDGIHFDEVGFSRPWQSLCDRCRQRFSADTGLAVPDWPNDVIRVAKATPAAIHDLAAWRGEHFDAFIRWRCGRVTDYLRRLCDAARSVRPLVVSYAAMAEQWADPLYYGEDLAELAKVFDFLVPMSYYTQYSMSQGRPEWTAEVCRSLAEWAHQGNPACKVYAGISAYGSDGGWREPLRDTFQRLVAEGALTAEQQQEHLHYTTCREAFESLEWLRSEAKIRPEEYEQLRTTLDERTPTSDEILRAVESVRAARLPGFVFFRYFCMFEDHTQGVIGKDLWPRLQQAFPAPAALPHAR
jgi:hypothetical protein